MSLPVAAAKARPPGTLDRTDASPERLFLPWHARRWFRVLLYVLAVSLVLDYGLSLLLEHGWWNRYLTEHLEAAFGRPVQVSNYSFSLLEGPRLEANYITVGEDPRFGHEYFLRADQLAVGLRWRGLLRGRMELGTLSFARPSLNLVRLPNGVWNLESWLPHSQTGLSNRSSAPSPALRLGSIDISGGRVDFKQGPDKLPMAFVDVRGSVDQILPGTWRIRLDAQPFRAAVALQQPGTLRLSGLVGGTSSRLRPASLELDWSDAALSDILRLSRGYDYGVRGLFAMQVNAQSVGSDWNFLASAQLRQLHSWDLPLRADDPAANVELKMRWLPGASQFDLTDAVVETPDANLHANGALHWRIQSHSSKLVFTQARFRLHSSSLELGDLLAWYRAFHPEVADQLALRGSATLHLAISGWPPRIDRGVISTQGADLVGGSLLAPIHVGRATVNFSRNAFAFAPVAFSIGTHSAGFHLQGSFRRSARIWKSLWKLDGRTEQVKTLTAAAAALGQPLPPGWSLEGPAQFHLRWRGAPKLSFRHPAGAIELTGLKIGAPFLNHEISHVYGEVSFSGNSTKINLARADAFAAFWQGSLERRRAVPGWRFHLGASDLSAAEMDRWLNPQKRESLMDRVFPFLATPPRPEPVPSWLHGQGTLAVRNFTVSPLTLRQLRADASVEGRRIHLTNTRASLDGGTLRGSIRLDLNADPRYDVKAKFDSVNLRSLAAHTFSLNDLFGGDASGNLAISAKGVGRRALLRSLTCSGSARIRKPKYRGMDLRASMRMGVRRPGVTSFSRASANFVCANGQVRFARLELVGSDWGAAAAGHVDFQRQMNFDVQRVSAGKVFKPDSPSPRDVFEVSGPLKAPQLTRLKRSSTNR